MKVFQVVFPALAMALMVLIWPIYAQVPTSSCTSSMLSSFTPCMNYLTNSSGTGTSPTSDCCTSLRSLMTNGTDCLCQIVMGGVPFRIPINRTLAVSLPKACNQAGVPVQCKDSAGSPVPAPGPVAFGPSASPAAAVAPSPSVPKSETPALAPVSDTPTLTPPSTTDGSMSPTSTSGAKTDLTPSASVPSLRFPPSIMLFTAFILIVKYF